jgi:hypothetical protein
MIPREDKIADICAQAAHNVIHVYNDAIGDRLT